jgi:hypothetical protein
MEDRRPLVFDGALLEPDLLLDDVCVVGAAASVGAATPVARELSAADERLGRQLSNSASDAAFASANAFMRRSSGMRTSPSNPNDDKSTCEAGIGGAGPPVDCAYLDTVGLVDAGHGRWLRDCIDA